MSEPIDQHDAVVAELLPLVLEGLADTDQFNRLNARLRDHAQARLYYLQYMDLHAELGGPSDILVSVEAHDILPDVFSEVIADALKVRQLRDLELQAQAQLEQNLKHERQEQQETVVTADRSKLQIVIPRWAVIGSVAAAAALIVLAALPFLQGEAPQQHPIVHQDIPAESVPAPVIEPIVATLTATRDAQWADSDLAIDDRLVAGQRLSLTAGFAEITTSRGAVAILEAPVTIEMIDSPNAIRLIAGKLIGICETTSSKGFLVRTPHMDVTDLGTRFGIDVSDQNAVEVHVFLGEVEVSRPALNTDDQHLTENLLQGEAVRISADTQKLERTAVNISLFETTTSRVIPLRGTGQEIKAGQPDPNWKIVAVDDQPLDPPHVLNVDSGTDYDLWPSTDLPASSWLSWRHDIEPPANGKNTYMFQTDFEIPTSWDQERMRMVMRYLADNQLVAVHLNGHRIALEPNDADANERMTRSFVIEKHFVAGKNVIAFEVENVWTALKISNPVGLRLEAELQEQVSPTNGDWQRRLFQP